MRIALMLMLITLVEGFMVNTPIRNYKKFIDNNVVKVFEPYNIEKNQINNKNGKRQGKFLKPEKTMHRQGLKTGIDNQK